MTENPYSLNFGIEPSQYINRISAANDVINTFSSDIPSNSVFMIEGVRGSGKTVFLSDLSGRFSKMDEWIVVNVTPDTDVIMAIAAKLYSRPELAKLFISAKLDFSAFGLGVSIEGTTGIFDIETVLEKMLSVIKKHHKRLLICIDEVVNNEHMRTFTGSYQLIIRQKLPAFLLMTGLYQNINNLQNEKTLTFLYSAPKINLEPLNLQAVAMSYMSALKVDADKSIYMAKLTKGYAYAYQVLGYLYYKYIIETGRFTEIDQLIPEFDQTLTEFVYEKIWFELSATEKNIVAAISGNDKIKVQEIREKLNLSSGTFSVYRDRLSKKGLLDTSEYGYVSLKLPRFGEVIRVWID